MAEHDRVRDFHHGRFQVQRPKHTFGLGILDLLGVKLAQSRAAHIGAIDHFTSFNLNILAKLCGLIVGPDKFDLQGIVFFHHDGFLSTVEIALAHVGDVGQ